MLDFVRILQYYDKIKFYYARKSMYVMCRWGTQKMVGVTPLLARVDRTKITNQWWTSNNIEKVYAWRERDSAIHALNKMRWDNSFICFQHEVEHILNQQQKLQQHNRGNVRRVSIKNIEAEIINAHRDLNFVTNPNRVFYDDEEYFNLKFDWSFLNG